MNGASVRSRTQDAAARGWLRIGSPRKGQSRNLVQSDHETKLPRSNRHPKQAYGERHIEAGGIAEAFLREHATVLMPQTKRQITLRLDPDVISFFKATGKGYQSRMGAVLKSYVEAKRKGG